MKWAFCFDVGKVVKYHCCGSCHHDDDSEVSMLPEDERSGRVIQHCCGMPILTDDEFNKVFELKEKADT